MQDIYRTLSRKWFSSFAQQTNLDQVPNSQTILGQS